MVLFIVLDSHIRDSLNICTFIINLLGLQVIFASKHCTPLLTLWFVGLILPCYYFLIILVKYGHSVIRFIILAFTILLFATLLSQIVGLIDERFILYFGIFVAGILGAKYKLVEKIKFSHVVFVSPLLVILVYFYVAFIHPQEIQSIFSFIGMSDLIMKNLIILCLVFVVFAVARVMIRADYYGLLQKIAYASYGMYLFHRPVWWIMVDIYNPANVQVKAVYLTLFGMPLTIFVSYYVQKFYDKYFRERWTTMYWLPSYPFKTYPSQIGTKKSP
jgi:peptidoglycan/LPS O-acetylase OafA/YrhL